MSSTETVATTHKPFDLAKYQSLVARLDLTGINFDGFKERPLDAVSLRCLRYMHDVEFHTVCYLRDLLVTRAHRDPAMTTFLTMWSYEEHWHGEAIAQVLAAHGEVAGNVRVKIHRGSLGLPDTFGTLTSMFLSKLFPQFPAVHMTWGAINEWTTQAGYAQLTKRANHPMLGELLKRIKKQEGRHIDVYLSESRRLLSESSSARRLTRFMLKHFWKPVGAGVMPESEVGFVVRELFGREGDEKMVDRIDQRIDQLPGLAGLNLIGTAVRKYT
jgi:hypothetical protein